MADPLGTAMRQKLERMSTPDLMQILGAEDRTLWSEDDLRLVHEILLQRGITRSRPPEPERAPLRLRVVVMIVTGLLLPAAMFAADRLDRWRSNARFANSPRARTKADMERYETALEHYRLDHGRFPTTALGLEALTKPTVRRPKGYLSLHHPYDGWRTLYEYTSDGRTFLIISYGSDGIPGGEGEDADVRSDDPE